MLEFTMVDLGALLTVVAAIVAVVIIRQVRKRRLLRDYGVSTKALTLEEIAKANSDSGKRSAYANGLMFASAGSTVQANLKNTKHLEAFAEATLAYDVSKKERCAEYGK
ncbi:MAG: hypothetical protein LBN43_00925 [Oscillospiraceae bacterium]|jgi:hypothetical protein|nr:hypothetical protein [Oscillospiraceae bacterium]